MHSESHTDLSIALLARIFQCSGSQWCKTGGLVWTGQHWICSTYFSPQAPVCRPRFEHLRKCCLLSMDGTEIKKEFSRGRIGCGWEIQNFPRKDFSDKSTAISARPTLTLFVLKLATIFVRPFFRLIKLLLWTYLREYHDRRDLVMLEVVLAYHPGCSVEPQ